MCKLRFGTPMTWIGCWQQRHPLHVSSTTACTQPYDEKALLHFNTTMPPNNELAACRWLERSFHQRHCQCSKPGPVPAANGGSCAALVLGSGPTQCSV